MEIECTYCLTKLYILIRPTVKNFEELNVVSQELSYEYWMGLRIKPIRSVFFYNAASKRPIGSQVPLESPLGLGQSLAKAGPAL